jgi:hypothetical protein
MQLEIDQGLIENTPGNSLYHHNQNFLTAIKNSKENK